MFANKLLPQVQAYLANAQARDALSFPLDRAWALTFLAQGEYNMNYLLHDQSDRKYVVRVNVGTQIGKAGGAQIAYEAAALRLLDGSGVAPSLHYLDDTLADLPYGLLVMEYLPGGPLDYGDASQLAAAAGTLARLHRVRVPNGSPFIYRRPLHDDLAEARGWLAAYLDCARAPQSIRAIFAGLLEHAARDAERHDTSFPQPFALVHTDVQAHNFIVRMDGRRTTDDGQLQFISVVGGQSSVVGCWLVDWERPLVDDPTYDLAHFLIPTTTQWKCGYTFSEREQALFLASYCAARPDLDPDELRERLRLRRPFILLRAISWCASAWVEYTGPGRAISNNDTLERIEQYLEPTYLAALFPEWQA